MKLEDLTKEVNWISTVNDLNNALEQPRQGKIFLYHKGMIAIDKFDEDRKGLAYISRMVQRNAERNQLMPFQKKIKDLEYIYFFVR